MRTDNKPLSRLDLETIALIKQGKNPNEPFGPSKSTLLERAVTSGLVEQVSHLLQCGGDPNYRGEVWPLLGQASDPAIAKLLLDKGANPDEIDGKGFTALMCAAGRGNVLLVKLLISYNANVHIGWGGLTALCFAAARGCPQGVFRRSGETDDYDEIMRSLVAAGANPNHANDARWTALQTSCLGPERFKSIRTLLSLGANSNAGDPANWSICTRDTLREADLLEIKKAARIMAVGRARKSIFSVLPPVICVEISARARSANIHSVEEAREIARSNFSEPEFKK